MTDALALASEFPAATQAQWRAAVDGVLKGAPFEKLVGKTSDGLPIAPMSPRAVSATPVPGRQPAAPWQVMARVDNPDPRAANAQALLDLENGATGLVISIAGGKGARGFGLPPTAEALAIALDGIYLDAGIGIELDLAPGAREVALHVMDLIEKRGVDPAAVHLRTGFDPIGSMASSGVTVPWSEATAPLFGKVIGEVTARGFKGPLAAADGRVVHDSGGSEAQELAYVLAVSVTYLRAIEAAGIPLDAARRAIFARLSADADQFLTIAKFRALRKLWASVERACGLDPQPLFVAAETAWRMLTQRDTDVNMLRATMAIVAAGLGGANSVSALPHTLAVGLPDALARRIARNAQLVLLEESNLAKVGDPVAGSGSIEAITSQLCETAWTLFQEIERAGGIVSALHAGLVQDKVAATRKARDANIAKRRDVLTGASEFPLLSERKPAVLAPAPIDASGSSSAFQPLVAMRLAQPFEALRDRSDAILDKTGARPRVNLVLLGTPADTTARMTFAKSFFETGGIEAVENKPSASPEGGGALVCICSSDKVYAAEAVEAAKALRSAGATHIYLAGRPGELETSLKEAGVTGFVYAGCDALAILTEAYQKVGKK